MIVTVTLTPALDKTVVIPRFSVGEVNRIQSLRLDAGGKGINVSKTLRALGGESVATGLVGGGAGKFIEDSLLAMGVECDFIHVPGETRTNLKVIDPELHTNTDVNEPGAAVNAETLEALLARVERRVGSGDVVVLAGKAPPTAPNTLFADWCRRLRKKGADVYMDADGALLIEGVKAKPTLIKPNDAELERVIGHKVSSMEEIVKAARQLAADGIDTVVVSLGGDGALFVKKDTTLRGKGLHVPVRSTVGAGDAMMAAMCYGALKELPFEETCRIAMAVSAAAVTCAGTEAPAREPVDELLKRGELEVLDVL